MCKVLEMLAQRRVLTGTLERPSPSDWLPEESVRWWAEMLPWSSLAVHLKESPKIWVPMIPDTNSMDGVFDFGNNNILIAGRNEVDQGKIVDALIAGDIAVYRTPNIYCIHRIVEISSDEYGKYFIFKGDNNPGRDPDRVRSAEILWVSVGTIY